MGDHTRGTLLGVFQGYGECTWFIDKNTGKAKGFGFVMFKTRKGAKEAVKERRASWLQWDQTGPGFGSMDNQGLSAVARATYVYPVYVREPIPSCLWRWNYKVEATCIPCGLVRWVRWVSKQVISGGIGSYFRGQSLPSAYPDSVWPGIEGVVKILMLVASSMATQTFHGALTCNL